ncbi:MAG: hypothetical protein ACLVBC_17665 [Parabacteroides distasonis]
MRNYDEAFHKEYMEEWPRASQRVNMKYLSYNNCTGDGPEYLELAGGPKETPLFHQQMQIWATPVMLNNADKKWALQRNYLDGLVSATVATSHRLVVALRIVRSTDALCRTDAGSFLNIWKVCVNTGRTSLPISRIISCLSLHCLLYCPIFG